MAAGTILGAGTFLFSDNPDLKKSGVAATAGATAILLSPYALAKVLTRPGLTKRLADGIKSSPTFTGQASVQLLTTLRRITEMKVAENFFKEQPSSNVIQYYTSDLQNKVME